MTSGLEKVLRGSVQKKILLLVFFSVLPSLAVIVNSGLERRDASLARAKAEAFALAEKAADVQKALAGKARAMLSAIAGLPEGVLKDPAAMRGILGRMLAENGDLADLFLADASGAAVVSTTTTPPLDDGRPPPTNIASGSAAFTVGESLFGQALSRPLLPFILSLHDRGLDGSAVAVVSLERFHNFVDQFDMPPGTLLIIADREGRILFSSAQPAAPPNGKMISSHCRSLLEGREDAGVGADPEEGNGGRIVAFVRLRLDKEAPPYGIVLAGIPSEAAMRQTRLAVRRDVLLVVTAAALALFTALVVGRVAIVQRLNRIIDAAGRVRAGDLGARSGLDYRDGELGLLAQAFDSMAHSLTTDIARRETAEKELKASRDFLDKIINSLADPIFVKDARHTFVLVNDALCAIIGKPREEVVGTNDYAYFPKEQVDYFWERDDQVLATGEEDHSEEFLTDKDGQTRITVTKKTRYVDGQGNPHVVGIIRDLTEVKRAGMELINRTAQLDARVKMLDCLYGISHLAQKRGLTLKQLLNEAALLLPPMLTYAETSGARILYEGVQYPSSGFTGLASSLTSDIVVRGVCKGFVEAGYTEPMPVQEEGPFTKEEGKILKVVAEHLGQMAERALAEEELRQSEERFRRIVETANEGIAVLDPWHRITYVNSIMAEMLGYGVDEIIGQHIESFLYEPSTGGGNNGRRHAPGGKRERLFLRKDGSVVCTIASVTPVTDREGRHAGSFSMYADITDRKMAEEKLHTLNESLEHLVRERTEDLLRKTADLETKARQLGNANRELTETAEKLEHSRHRAEEATKAKSVFLANMSHEVRTPINAILGLSDLALRRGAQGESRRYLEMILKSSRGLLSLVNDILDFSKLEAGKAEVESVDFDLPRLVKDALVTFAHQAEARGLALELTIDDDVPRFVVSDPTKLRAILANLFSNAVKFTEKGWVRVLASFQHGATTFQVEDTGIGIPEDKRRHIFKSFRQADESVGRKYGGTGLGLAISRKYARLLGGTLRYEPREGGGSRFVLTLPLRHGTDHEDGREQRRQALRRAESLPPLRILLAEDHEMARELITSFLAGFGHRVTCAEDGAQALEKLRQEPFDIVLMDGRMPVMDGLEAARAIRAGECGPDKADIPIVAITAQAMEGDRELYLRAGMDDYVTKPVDLDEVLLVLARHAPGGASEKAEPAAPPSREREEGHEGEGEAAPVPMEPDGAPKQAVPVTPVSDASPPEDAQAAPTPAPATGEDPAGLPLLDRQAALARLRGMTDLLQAMEDAFLKATPEDLAELSQSASDGDADRAGLYAHRVKGNAAGVGAAKLSAAARGMEAAARAGAVPSAEGLAGLKELFRLTAEEMNRTRA